MLHFLTIQPVNILVQCTQKVFIKLFCNNIILAIFSKLSADKSKIAQMHSTDTFSYRSAEVILATVLLLCELLPAAGGVADLVLL